MVNYMRLFICALACLFSIGSYASDPLAGRDEKIKQSRIAWAKKVQGLSHSEATSKVEAGLSQGKVKQTAKFTGTTQDGSRITATATVTKPIDKAKSASTLVERLKSSKEYAKKLGKASLPSFVGVAAFHGLMEGIGWVMDEGGKVTRLPPEEDTSTESNVDRYTSQYLYSYNYTSPGTPTVLKGYDVAAVCNLYHSYYGSQQNTFYNVSHGIDGSKCKYQTHYKNSGNVVGSITTITLTRSSNPDYQKPPEMTEPTDQELTTALKNALESNNPALAAAIAEAIKSAYSPDSSQGQSLSNSSTNGLASSSNDDIKSAINSAANNTGSEPSSDGKAGNYKITDGEKTIEGNVTSGVVTSPVDTTTKPVIDPVTGQPTGETSTSGSFDFPPFCDWAAVVCDWLDWTQQEPELPEEDSDIPSELLPVVFTPFQLVNFDASCPPDIPLELQIIGEPIHSVFPMQPFCTFFSGMQPFVLLLSMFVSVKIVAGSLNNTVF